MPKKSLSWPRLAKLWPTLFECKAQLVGFRAHALFLFTLIIHIYIYYMCICNIVYTYTAMYTYIMQCYIRHYFRFGTYAVVSSG